VSDDPVLVAFGVFFVVSLVLIALMSWWGRRR
jgi:hypothetical protein